MKSTIALFSLFIAAIIDHFVPQTDNNLFIGLLVVLAVWYLIEFLADYGQPGNTDHE